MRDQMAARATVDKYRSGPSLGKFQEDAMSDDEYNDSDEEKGLPRESTFTMWQMSSKPEWLEPPSSNGGGG